jgi:hypothetical protein
MTIAVKTLYQSIQELAVGDYVEIRTFGFSLVSLQIDRVVRVTPTQIVVSNGDRFKKENGRRIYGNGPYDSTCIVSTNVPEDKKKACAARIAENDLFEKAVKHCREIEKLATTNLIIKLALQDGAVKVESKGWKATTYKIIIDDLTEEQVLKISEYRSLPK